MFGDPNAPRFVLWNGKLRPVPSKPTDLPFFDLMSIGGKLRAGFGAIGIRPPPPVCSQLPSNTCFVYLTIILVGSMLCLHTFLSLFNVFFERFQGHEESVEEFVRRNLGDEVFERLIEPFCSGEYLAYYQYCGLCLLNKMLVVK